MDAIKCSSSFVHRTKPNILSSNHTFPKIHAPNFRRLFRPAARPLSLSVRAGKSSAATVGAENLAVVEKPPKSERFLISDGLPSPFGATITDDGVNFSVYSANSVSATLCLITLSDLRQNKVTEEIQLEPSTNRTGHVWHVFLKGDFKDMLYGYRFDGKFSPE